VVEAKQGKNGRVQIVDVQAVLDRVQAEFVGAADGL